MYYLQIPKISISPAPPEDPPVEPYSPFAFIPQVVVDTDAFRPVLLTPPCTVHHFKLRVEPPNRQEARGIGLDSQRFQQLLKATRERNASVQLRKELAIKIQKNNNTGRRALFLSRLQAPPSPTATTTPSTPPGSPSVFHYTLPSPGLTSPFSVFESVDKDTCEGWVETVYFEKHDTNNDNPLLEKRKFGPRVPSLEQISARMKPPTINHPHNDVDPTINPTLNHKRPLIGVGRLRMPLRGQSQPHATLASQSAPSSQPTLRTAIVVQDTADSISSDTKLTETNLTAFNVRGQRAQDMLCTLRRRTLPFATKTLFCDPGRTDEESKRHSAPPEMTSLPRLGFSHPILALPGGF